VYLYLAFELDFKEWPQLYLGRLHQPVLIPTISSLVLGFSNNPQMSYSRDYHAVVTPHVARLPCHSKYDDEELGNNGDVS